MSQVSNELCTHLTDIVVDAVLTIQQEGVPIDNHMVEMQALKHRLGIDTRLVRGLVLDHGPRHPDMPKRVENTYIFTCSLEMEYEKTCVLLLPRAQFAKIWCCLQGGKLCLVLQHSRTA